MLAKAVELAEAHGWFLCRQFENEANADIHSRTTAPEILEDFADVQLDYWVTGFGTGGTLKGVARVLREKSPQTRILVCEPDNSPLLGSGVGQVRAPDGAPAGSHPSFRPHLMQGWTPDFISKLTEDAVTQGLIDQIMPIPGDEALRLSRELAHKEGIFCGITAGATLAGGLRICRSSPAGTNVLCMLPDTGERYLSTPLFADIETEMTAEELEISRSTPGYRFDRPSAAPAASTAVNTTPDAETFVAQALSDPAQPVVMFALEWCEFCWSLRKLFAKCGIDYRSVDLDSAQYQQDNLGGTIRAALSAHTGCITIPQIFVAGEFIGGCTEVFDEFKSGRLQQRLEQAGVVYDTKVTIDPYSLLPSWLHPRQSS